jgi:hypothetical protein
MAPPRGRVSASLRTVWNGCGALHCLLELFLLRRRRLLRLKLPHLCLDAVLQFFVTAGVRIAGETVPHYVLDVFAQHLRALRIAEPICALTIHVKQATEHRLSRCRVWNSHD